MLWRKLPDKTLATHVTRLPEPTQLRRQTLSSKINLEKSFNFSTNGRCVETISMMAQDLQCHFLQSLLASSGRSTPADRAVTRFRKSPFSSVQLHELSPQRLDFGLNSRFALGKVVAEREHVPCIAQFLARRNPKQRNVGVSCVAFY